MRRFLASIVTALGIALCGASSAQLPASTFILVFDAPPGADELAALGVLASGVHGFSHVPAAVAVAPAQVQGLLANLPGVRGVFVNYALIRHLRQSTRTIRADAVWDGLGVTGAGIGVAIIDTGIDGTHPDLCAAATFCRGTAVKTVQNVKILGRQDVAADPVVVLEDQLNTDTSSGHGTHVAGIAAGLGVASTEPGKYLGVAPGARLIGLGTGEAVEAVNVLAAFDWVIAHKDDPRYNIKVINNSYGPGKGTAFDPNDPMQRAIAAAYDAGLTVVFGAGNDGPATDTMNAFSANPKALSAAGGAKDGHIAFFSSRGVPGHPLWRPTITTPGYNIASVRASTGFYGDIADATAPNPDAVVPPDTLYYASASGTSMAAPHVAGLVALMQEASFAARGVYLTPAQVKNVLQNTAVSGDAARGPGGLPQYQEFSMGAGYADALAAVQAAAAGTQLQAHDDGVAYDVRGFSGTITPLAGAFETSVTVNAGAVSLNVMADWSAAASDVDIELYRPDGSLHSSTFMRCAPADEPNGYSSFCTQVANERTSVVAPQAGSWRAVVKASVLGSDSVRGVWSVAYADGAVLPAAQTAASVTITAPGATGTTGVAGQDVALVATVRDAAGNAVPSANVTWSSAGVGGYRLAETATHADGTARAWASSTLPGTQTASAQSGTATASTSITWLGLTLPPLPAQTSAPGKASGGGWIMDPNKRHFAFWAEYASSAAAAAGELSFDDRQGNIVSANSVSSITFSGASATVKGPATFNGASGYRFELAVTDNGSPGRNDTFRLVVTRPLNPLFRYETDGTLGGGNIKVAH